MTMFVREFNVEAQAEKFAKANGGTVTVRYDYDTLKGRIIKIFRVKY